MTEKPPERMFALQQRFAGHLRDPEGVPAPEGLEDRRLAIYRRLFFNNLKNLFARNFPVIRKLTSDQQWDALIREFMTDHRSHTPMFTEIGGEFVEFLAERADSELDQPGWLVELAHWEFLETCVRLDDQDVNQSEAPEPDALMDQVPRVNPTLKLAEYQWPVHRIGPAFQPEQPEPVLLAVYRHPDDKVAFMKINAMTARVLAELQQSPGRSGKALFESIAAELGRPAQEVLSAGKTLLSNLAERSIIIATIGTSFIGTSAPD